MAYVETLLKKDFEINKIVTVHYFSYASNFSFPGETHDFWEFVYVDNGTVEINGDGNTFILKKGQIHFHKPNEFHALKATGVDAPNLVVVSFICKSKAMKFFENATLPVSDMDCAFLRTIISEAKELFDNPLNDPSTEVMEVTESPRLGAAQLISASLEALMITLVRENSQDNKKRREYTDISMTNRGNDDALLLQKLKTYFEDHISNNLSIEKICSENFVGYSRLKTLYRKYYRCSLMEYFSSLKIEAAKQMIRDRHLNISEISDALGYSSIGYFSRYFKIKCGMSPSEYASSVLALSEKTNFFIPN